VTDAVGGMWATSPVTAGGSKLMSVKSDRQDGSGQSREFWDSAAREDAMWHIATGAASDSETFFRSGRQETDTFLAHAGLVPDRSKTVLEIGCGMGRMTARLAELYGSVIAVDVSPEMLDRARDALAGRTNVRYLLGGGSDLSMVDSASVDAVFSYIVLQHVPTVAGQLGYLRETRRVLRPGGAAAIQIRANTPTARGLDWAGHLRHRVQGHHTFSRAWRGVRVPRTDLLAAASGVSADGAVDGPTAAVELRPFGRRHTWVVMRRNDR
jgi:SAM-dependent methyltransferase